jgi:hypothetical protein
MTKISASIWNKTNSQVIPLVDELQALCEANGLTLSRWQTNGAKHRTTITYAIHKGGRAAQFRLQHEVLDWNELSQSEGATARCEAYRKIAGLLDNLKQRVANGNFKTVD